MVPDCWSGCFNLHPDFFAAIPGDTPNYPASGTTTMTIRIQHGSDYESFSDGVIILIDDVAKVRGDDAADGGAQPSLLGQPLAVNLPPGVVPPGVPITPVASPAMVHATLYLDSTCRTQDDALYALGAVSGVGPDGDCQPSVTDAGTCPGATKRPAQAREGRTLEPARGPSGRAPSRSPASSTTIRMSPTPASASPRAASISTSETRATSPREASAPPPVRGSPDGHLQVLLPARQARAALPLTEHIAADRRRSETAAHIGAFLRGHNPADTLSCNVGSLSPSRAAAVRTGVVFVAMVAATGPVYAQTSVAPVTTSGARAMQQARSAWDDGDFDIAPGLYRAALRAGGLRREDVVDAYVRIGGALAATGRAREAHQAFRLAALLNPGFSVPAEAGKRAVAARREGAAGQRRAGSLALSAEVADELMAGSPFPVDVALAPIRAPLVDTVHLEVRDPLAGHAFEQSASPDMRIHFDVPMRMTLPDASLIVRVRVADARDNELLSYEKHVHVKQVAATALPPALAALRGPGSDDTHRSSGGGFWNTAWPYVIGGAALAAGSAAVYFGTRPSADVYVGQARVERSLGAAKPDAARPRTRSFPLERPGADERQRRRGAEPLGGARGRHVLPRALPRRRRDRHRRHGERAPRAHGRPRRVPEVGRHQAHPPAPRRGRVVRATCSSTRRASRRASRTRTSRRCSSSASTTTRYWIAMEYLHGEPLREVMRRTEELGAADAAGDRLPRHRRRRRGPARRARAARQERREARPRPPRRHAAQPVRHLRRQHEGRRLRHREVQLAHGATRARARSRASSRTCRRSRSRGEPHRSPHRHLRARRRPLGADDRPAPLPHGKRSRHAREGAGVQRPAAEHASCAATRSTSRRS